MGDLKRSDYLTLRLGKGALTRHRHHRYHVFFSMFLSSGSYGIKPSLSTTNFKISIHPVSCE